MKLTIDETKVNNKIEVTISSNCNVNKGYLVKQDKPLHLYGAFYYRFTHAIRPHTQTFCGITRHTVHRYIKYIHTYIHNFNENTNLGKMWLKNA